VAAAGCSRCGSSNAASAEELLPSHPSAAVITAPLGAVAQHLAALGDRAASLPGGEQLGDNRRALAAQLGFDPFTRDGLASAGLDPDRGAAVALFEAQPRVEWIAALPVAKPDAFLAAIERVLVERAGFARASEQAKGARIYQRGGQGVAVQVIRGYGVVARTADAASAAAQAESRTAQQALAHERGLETARKQLGAQDFVVWLPGDSALPRRFAARPLPGDAALSLQGSEQGLATRLVVQLPAADAQRAQATLPGGGADLVELLPADAPVRGRLGVAPARLLESLRADARLAPVLQQLGGADAEAFASVAPGVALSLSLARGADLGPAVDYGLDWRRKSPFDTVQLVALALVSDRPRLVRALDQVAKALPQLGARVERTGDDFQVTYSGGRGARFGIRELEGKPIAYLMGGPLRPDELRRVPRSGNPEAAALYQDGGAALRIDFGKLAAALRELPQAAYGSGPQAYVSRSFVGQVIEPLRTVRVTVAAEAFPDRLGASLDVELVRP